MKRLQRCEHTNELLQESESGWFYTIARIGARHNVIKKMFDKFLRVNETLEENKIVLTNHRDDNQIDIDAKEFENEFQKFLDELYLKKYKEKYVNKNKK